MNRRAFLTSAVAAALCGGRAAGAATGPVPGAGRAAGLDARLRRVEAASGGRLGVCVLDTADGHEAGHRADERFLMLSTFKVLAGALVLHRVDNGDESLSRRVPFSRADLLDFSPVTGRRAGGDGMTVAELCAAAIGESDNTAGNLLLESFGGPAALTAFARSLGDPVTRLDRTEPALNTGHAGDLLDTTSPRAMARTLERVALGDALSAPSRRQLQAWLLASTTGAHRLRAGLPGNWRIGDKTGTNATGASDVGILWPPQGRPLVVAAYLAETRAPIAVREATLAAVGAAIASGAWDTGEKNEAGP